ncbi:hypothetical protein F5148DRAFT_322460 [Russula earlei]|uniref:Uncharacterized protein n=1 Tax=Russula earlei TaxID=71964 RepID=A0ACC0U2C6_9AGAM|nr:hypothetical protein F5148DRAFT_322460 [Russula earlei]
MTTSRAPPPLLIGFYLLRLITVTSDRTTKLASISLALRTPFWPLLKVTFRRLAVTSSSSNSLYRHWLPYLDDIGA